MTISRWTFFFILLCVLHGVFGDPIEARPSGDSPSEPPKTRLQMTLTEGSSDSPKVISSPIAPGVALPKERAKELLRMFAEPLQQGREESELFHYSASKAPLPPVANPTALDLTGSPDQTQPKAELQGLQVVSITPQGTAERAARLSISFSNPMRALGNFKEKADPTGISLVPRPKGSWRWLDTQTVIFEPEASELPRATTYTIRVSAQISDLQGRKPAAPISRSLTLSPPNIIASTLGTKNVGLEPLLTVKFDQPVVRESVLSKAYLQTTGGRIPIREISAEEAEAKHTGIKQQVKSARQDTIFLLTPSQPLTPGADYTLVVAPGVKSQEGPQRMEQAFHATFSTYQPLKLLPPKPNDLRGPRDALYLGFNNDIDQSSFEPSFVTVTPTIPDMEVRSRGSWVGILGTKVGNSTYKVTVSPRLSDTFGQTLAKPVTANFITGPFPKRLVSDLSSMAVLDPTVSSRLTFFSTNIEKVNLEVRRVEPEDWDAYSKLKFGRIASVADHSHEKFPGIELAKTTLSIEGQSDTLVETQLDLSKYLHNGKGNLIVLLTDPTANLETRRYREILTWVQGTSLGLDLEASATEVVGLVTTLQDGQPIGGAQLKVGDRSGTTKPDGSIAFPLPKKPSKYTIVRTETDQAFLPGDPRFVRGRGPNWKDSDVNGDWLLFTDRDLYRPGETAHIKGYVRQWRGSPPSKLQKVGEPGQTVHWQLEGNQGEALTEGETELSAFGSIDFKLEVPKKISLGPHYVSVRGDGLPKGYVHRLYVDEFRRPEFEVATRVLSPGPHLLQSSVIVKATAGYYAGGALAGTAIDWYANGEDATYTPPGRGGYTFGAWTPWWDMGAWWPEPYEVPDYHEFAGETDAIGQHNLEISFDRLYPPRPIRVSVGASVTDVNDQRRSGRSTFLLHPSARYVGLKSVRSFVDERSGFDLEAIVTDIDGNILTGVPIKFSLLKISYELDGDGAYREVETLSQEITATSDETPVEIHLDPSKTGSYYVRAEVMDELGRPNRTDYRMWKGNSTMPTQGKMQLEPLSLVPDRKEYASGQKAQILVMAPFMEGEGLVVWAHDGVLEEERFSLKNGSATLQYPLTEELLPNLNAKVTVVGKTSWGDGERPAIAAGKLSLPISCADRKLTVKLLPGNAKLAPGDEVELEAVVKDSHGQPVKGGEVTLWMADEAVLDQAGYSAPDPFGVFYQSRPSGLTSSNLRHFVALGSPGIPGKRSPQERNGDMSAEPPPLPLPGTRFMERENLNPLAVFRGNLLTDASGTTKIKVKLPDNLTRYRIYSVAVKDDAYFGTGDQVLTAQLPVMLRPSLPRFLNFGDKAGLPVVIQNLTDKPIVAEVVGEALGVSWVGPAARRVKVPANDRTRVMFECRADQVGTARFRFGVVASGGVSDAANHSLPVYAPATKESFATYGSIANDGAVSQAVHRPSNIWNQLGGLQLSLSSTALSELSDAFLYLYTYPYQCCEQKASRLLTIAALRDVLADFHENGLPDSKSLDSRVADDLRDLVRLQNSDGGWEFWRRDGHSIPFVSVHVAHALVRLKSSGYEVDEDALSKAMGYLAEIESKCSELKYDPKTTRSCLAYALFVRHLSGKPDVAHTRSLFMDLTREKEPDLEALGWLWPTLQEKVSKGPELAELKRQVMNRVSQTADTARFATRYGESDSKRLVLHSDQRTNAIMLYGLLDNDVTNPLNEKLLRGLLARRVKGRWQSTQENAWAVLAAQKYFRSLERETPSFTARAWLGSQYLAEETFDGRSGEEAHIEVPMASLPREATELVLQKKGSGRLYYRVGVSLVPKVETLPPENHGFTVERRYRGLDNSGDVTQNDQGDWQIKAGARVEVELTLAAPEERHHVALIDLLPSGLEASEPLKIASDTGWRSWHEHENLRDDRVEVFASLLKPGVYSYKYVALATTPGDFVLPPAKAEEMYSPETSGRSESARLTIR